MSSLYSRQQEHRLLVIAEKSQDLRSRGPRAAGAQEGQDQLLQSSADAFIQLQWRRGQRERRLGLVAAQPDFGARRGQYQRRHCRRQGEAAHGDMHRVLLGQEQVGEEGGTGSLQGLPNHR